MSQLNFGERYFATRERISQVIKDISRLAAETGTDLGDTFDSTSLCDDLGTPFLFLVCGEVNAGKSSLINGLFGHELCKVSILPETDRVIRYRYGEQPEDMDTTSSLQDRFRPIEFLRDFNLVDTPGTNSINNGHQEITGRFVPIADLILFVFPVSNPWGAATWDLISKMPEECHHRMVFVLQQIDQRDSSDIKVILGHMADLSMKRIGYAPQIFAISAKLASEAKSAGSLADKNHTESGFPLLQEFISNQVCDSTERRATLQTSRTQAYSALRMIEDYMEGQTRVLETQNDFLASLEDEIDTMREKLVIRLPSHLAEVAVTFETEAVRVTRALRKLLGLFRSVVRIFIGDKTGSQTESLLIERLRTAVESVAENDGADVVIACRSHWNELGVRVKDSIGTSIGESESIDENLEQARQRFVQRIGRSAHQAIGNLHVRKDLERELRRRNLALKSFTATTLVLMIFGAICGILELEWLPWIFCMTALLFLLGGMGIAILTRSRITRDFQSSLLDTCGAFAETLRNDYEDALRIFFQEYTACLDSIRKHLVKKKMAIEPKLQRWTDLFLTLKSIEQDI